MQGCWHRSVLLAVSKVEKTVQAEGYCWQESWQPSLERACMLLTVGDDAAGICLLDLPAYMVFIAYCCTLSSPLCGFNTVLSATSTVL